MPPPERTDAESYAESLLALADAAGAHARMAQDLAACADRIAHDESLMRFLADETVRVEGRQNALTKLLDTDLGPEMRHFLMILIEHRALGHLPAITEHFFTKFSARRDRMAGELVVAHPVTHDQVLKIEEATGRILGRPVQLRLRVEPTLLGGCRVYAGDFILDGTLDHRLECIRRTLVA